MGLSPCFPLNRDNRTLPQAPTGAIVDRHDPELARAAPPERAPRSRTRSIQSASYPCNTRAMNPPDPIDALSDRVERLLLRHEQLLRANELLQAQLTAVTRERDALRQRLREARSRVDALIARLPAEDEPGETPA